MIDQIELVQRVRANPAEREALIQYLIASGNFPSSTDIEARDIFEWNFQRNTPNFRVWVGAYLPEYNAAHPTAGTVHVAPGPATPVGPAAHAHRTVNIRGHNIDERVVHTALGTVAVAVGGLTGMLLGPDEGNVIANAIDAGSKAALITSPAWGLTMGYATSQRARKAAVTAAGLATLGLFGHFMSQTIGSEAAANFVDYVSKGAIIISPIASVARYFKR